MEVSTNVKFVPMTYNYAELLSQMKIAELSPWDNLWNDAIDLTTKRASMSRKFSVADIQQTIQWNFIPPLEWAEEAFAQVKVHRGKYSELNGLHEITRADLEAVVLRYDEEETAHVDRFDLGSYFNQFAHNIMKGGLPV